MGIVKKPIIECLQEEFLPYSSELILNNLPSIDGCLRSHRKILWGMYRGKYFPDKPFYKSVKIMGTLVSWYIYGTAPLYSTMVTMTNNSMNIPYIKGKGSWGNKLKANGQASAERYTEAKLNFYGLDMLSSIDKNTVKMIPNYDNTDIEPVLLPSIMPNILLNMSQSISISESSKIPPHNVNDTCDAIISYIKNNDIDETISIIKCPDFTSSGGQIVYNKETFNQIYKTGRGTFSLIGKYRYDNEKRIFSIYEIPYETTIEAIATKLRKAYDKELFKEIIDFRNSSGKDGIGLDIYLKKNTNINVFEAKLREHTPYESKLSCNFTVLDLDCKTPKLMSLNDIIEKWVQHRHNCITNETIYDINQKQVELNKLNGLKIISNDLDKAIQIIRNSKNEKTAIDNLIKEFNLNEDQSKYISTIRLVNINQEWIFNKIKNISDLKNEIKSLEAFKSNKKAIDELIISQLNEVKKKYGVSRKTSIIYPHELEEISTDQLIDDYSCYVAISKEGYLYKYLRKTDKFKLKEGDSIIKIEPTSNKATLLVFTDKGMCYKLFLHDIEEKVASSQLGHYLPSLLELKNENIMSTVVTRKYEGSLINIFENGRLAKINLQSFKTEQKRSSLKNAMSLESPLVSQFIITDNVDILSCSSIDKVLVVNTSQFNAKDSKNTNGDWLMKPKNDSTIIFSQLLDNVNTEKIEDIEYYRANRNSIGTFLKKSDTIIMK